MTKSKHHIIKPHFSQKALALSIAMVCSTSVMAGQVKVDEKVAKEDETNYATVPVDNSKATFTFANADSFYRTIY
jgi:hypothetical protein